MIVHFTSLQRCTSQKRELQIQPSDRQSSTGNPVCVTDRQTLPEQHIHHFSESGEKNETTQRQRRLGRLSRPSIVPKHDRATSLLDKCDIQFIVYTQLQIPTRNNNNKNRHPMTQRISIQNTIGQSKTEPLVSQICNIYIYTYIHG